MMAVATSTAATDVFPSYKICSHAIERKTTCLCARSFIHRFESFLSIIHIRLKSMSRPPKLTLSILLPFVLLVVAFISSPAIAQACAAGSAKQINGNWYCSEVDAITYHNFPGYGQYNKVTHMDPKTGECETKVNQYSGSLSPLDEEVGHLINEEVKLC